MSVSKLISAAKGWLRGATQFPPQETRAPRPAEHPPPTEYYHRVEFHTHTPWSRIVRSCCTGQRLLSFNPNLIPEREIRDLLRRQGFVATAVEEWKR